MYRARAARRPGRTPPPEGAAQVTDATPDGELRALLSLLMPSADAALLVPALRAEAERGGGAVAVPRGGRASELPPPERELHRVRAQLALGEAARMLQHAINNPLTAMLAEAQLLELEAVDEPQRLAAARMVALARRVAAIVRRLDDGVAPGEG